MVTRHSIKFKPADSPINGAVTKFGGQPNWIESAQWPISAELDSPMRFICQIKLTEDLFPGCEGKVAYIFMTEDEDYADGTWEPDGGENAVIIQPGGVPPVPVRPLETGPTLQQYIEVDGFDKLQPKDVEFSVELKSGQDPAFIPEMQRFDLLEDKTQGYMLSLDGNKIGGTPGFMQGDEFPSQAEEWLLLLQLDSCEVPFSVNFGDAGIAYAFVNKSSTAGKFLWQCC